MKEIKKHYQTLHHKKLKLLPKIKTVFQLWWAAKFALLRKLLRTYFVMIIRTLKTFFKSRTFSKPV